MEVSMVGQNADHLVSSLREALQVATSHFLSQRMQSQSFYSAGRSFER